MTRQRRSGFVEDALVVAFVLRDDVVGAVVFLGVDAGDLAHFAAAVGGERVKTRSLRKYIRSANNALETEGGGTRLCRNRREIPPLRGPACKHRTWEKAGPLRSE
jgi:hypothetical protein